jgi:hypothetical protein
MIRPARALILGSLVAYAVFAARQASAQLVAAQRPKHLIVAVDRSGSRTPQQMIDMRTFIEKLILQTDFGDEISVVEVMQDGNSHVREFRDSLPKLLVEGQPTRKEVLIRDALRRSYRGAALKYVDTTGVHAIRSTDLFATLRRVSNYTASGRRQYLVLLSDMLQSTTGQSFASTAGVPDASWIAAQRRGGMLPNLSGVCVAAVGVDDTPRRAARVKAFWAQYLDAAGALLPAKNYRATMDDAHVECP